MDILEVSEDDDACLTGDVTIDFGNRVITKRTKCSGLKQSYNKYSGNSAQRLALL